MQHPSRQHRRRHDPAFRRSHQDQPDATTAGTGACGWRRTDRAPTTRMWSGSGLHRQNTIFKTAQTQLHYYTDGGYGPMTSGSGSPGYAGVGSPGNLWVTPVQSNSSFYAIYERVSLIPARARRHSRTSRTSMRRFRISLHPPLSASGELLDGGVVSGVQTVNATVADSGGGARSIVVYVNGIRSASSNICGPDIDGVSYSHLKPCPDSSGPRAIQLDTEHGARLGQRRQ